MPDRTGGETRSNLKNIIYAYLRSQGAQGPYWTDDDPREMWWLPDLGGRTFIEVVRWLCEHEQVEEDTPNPRRLEAELAQARAEVEIALTLQRKLAAERDEARGKLARGEPQAERERVIKLIWDAINDDEDWGSIQDVRNLADEILGVGEGHA